MSSEQQGAPGSGSAPNGVGAEGAGEEQRPAGAAQEVPTEEELRAAYEAELSRMTSIDLIAQAVVSLLNLGARRLGLLGAPGSEAGARPGSERDLEQVRDAIDAVRGLLEILGRRMPEEMRPLRDALAQLQMAYAREMQGAGGEGAGAQGGEPGAGAGTEPAAPGTAEPAAPGTAEPGAAGSAGSQEAPGKDPQRDEPGPAQKSGRLWVPGS